MDDSPGTARFPSTRLLLLALDAVPHRVVAAAFDSGAFDGWCPPIPVVAPFPSLTHPAFAALFAPFGVGPSWGYEVRYFDVQANAMAGGNPLTYRHRVPPWGRLIDSGHEGVVGKGANYVTSMRAALGELDGILGRALDADQPAYVGYLGSTDALMHLYGDDAAVAFVGILAERCEQARIAHLRRRGVPLRIGLFSDHGCGQQPVHYTGDIRAHLREAGLRVVDRLVAPGDVVAPTFGIVNYLALFLADPSRAAQAADALVDHPAVDLVAFRSAAEAVEVIGRSGRASLRWMDVDGQRLIGYHPRDGDVLDLSTTVECLRSDGRIADAGLVRDRDWVGASARSQYPDGPARIIDALTGDRVRSRATVLASLGPGWSWGWRSAYLGTLVRSGRLKGTHGGLDRESSLAFLAVSDAGADPLPLDGDHPRILRASQALAAFAPMIRANRQERR